MVAHQAYVHARYPHGYNQNAIRNQQLIQERKWLLETAEVLEQHDFYRQAEEFRRCHKDGVFAAVHVCREKPWEHQWPIPYGCRLPICPVCSRYVASERVRTYADPVLRAAQSRQFGYSPKLITLTTPYTPDRADFPALFEICCKGVDQVFTAVFRSVLGNALSVSDRKKGRVTLKEYHLGYLAAAQWGEDGGNLHFHALVYSPFLPASELTEQWSHFTGGKHSVHVAGIKPTDDDICSTIAYISRLSTYPPAMSPRLAAFLKARRRFWNKGIFYAHQYPARRSQYDCPICHAALVRTGYWPNNHEAHQQWEE